MKKNIAKIVAATGSALCVAVTILSLSVAPVAVTGCVTTGGGVVTNLLVGTNGVLTDLALSAIDTGVAVGLAQAIAKSPQHASAIEADAAAIYAALSPFTAGGANTTAANFAAALSSLKLNTVEAQAVAALASSVWNTIAAQALAYKSPVAAYIPAFATAVRAGILASGALN